MEHLKEFRTIGLQFLCNTLKFLMVLVLFVGIGATLRAQSPDADPTLTKLFEDTYHTWELKRNDKGIYRDSKVFVGDDFHPASIANVGTGLISLCIADAMGWEPDAATLALTTLQSVNGQTPGFTPDRNASGYFRHFIDMETGEQAWESEYSTIDTDILALGAMFCKNYFSGNAEIAAQVDQLWNSIDFTKAIANPDTGQIYLDMQANGEGGTLLTSVYNEYMLVAWCAINDANFDTTEAQLLWDNFYADPENLPKATYGGFEVLTDSPGNFVSSFIHLFNYYLVDYFASSPAYMTFFDNAYNADKQWWADTAAPPYAWGHGAGVDIEGYAANKINDNPNRTVSPHIIGGFLPVNPDGKNDLLDQYNNSLGVYSLPDDASREILWRYSLNDPSFVANSVQGIDLSTLLYGLASLPEYLGTDFFDTNNEINTTALVCDSNTLPATIRAADFCRMFGVEGDPVGFIDAGDFMEYSLDVPTTGTYNVSVSYASPEGGQFEFRVNGTATTVDLPATGSFGDYGTVDTTLDLEQGTQTLRLQAITGGYNLEAYFFELSTADPIPGTIVASDFDRMFGVMGDPVGFIDAGDWMEYDVQVATTGRYGVSVRFASPDGGDQFEFQVDGETKTVVDVPATGGFGDYELLDTTIELERGARVLRVEAITGGYNLDRYDFTLINSSPMASAGEDITIEDRDNNGSEEVTLDGSLSTDPDGTLVSYNWAIAGQDSVTGATPTVSLPIGTHTATLTVTDDAGGTAIDEVIVTVSDAVPITFPGTISAANWNRMFGVEGDPVGFIDAGDWMEYDIVVPETGIYSLSVSYASPDGGQFEFQVDGATKAVVDLTATGGYGDYQDLNTTIELEQGNQVLRLEAITAGYNLEGYSFRLMPPVAPVPGIIVAAEWQRMSGVDGNPVGFIDAGDWMEYDIEVSEGGLYDVSVLFASPDGGDQFEFRVDGETKTVVDVPATGGFADYENLDTTIELEQGFQVLRVQAITGGYNLDTFSFVKRPVLETTVLSFSDFEDGFGIWTDGGKDCALKKGKKYAHQGKASIRIRDDSGIESSFYHTQGVNLTPYESLKVEFWYKAKKMPYGKGFVVEYYDGSVWQEVADFKAGRDFYNEVFYTGEVVVDKTDYDFPLDAKLRFRSKGLKNKSQIFVDEVKISAQGYSLPSTSKTIDSEAKTPELIVDIEAKADTTNGKSYDMVLYPNSVARGSSFRVRLTDESENGEENFLIEVYSLTGQRIFQENVQGNDVEISMQNLSKGLYFVRSTYQGKTVTKRLIVE
ncbi:MAG: carbohydrate-binding protein [Pricia sp.]